MFIPEENKFEIIDGQNFDYQVEGYSPYNAEILAFLAMLVYEKESDIQATLEDKTIVKDFELDYFRFFEKDETQAFVLAHKQNIIFSFRGTEPEKIDDWQVNLSLKLVESYFGKVHKGFNTAFLEIWENMKDSLKELSKEYTAQNIWLTGHSLGGALGTLAGMYLQMENIQVNGLYTFGSPKVGNEEFAKKFDELFKEKHFRFINNNDGVVLVPFHKYRHTGTSMYFDRRGNLHTDLSPWQKWVDSLKGNLQAFRKFSLDYISDHSMNNYLKLLQKNKNYNPFGN